MYQLVCEESLCSGCGACIDVCVRNALKIESGLEQICAKIDETRCMDCGLCRAVCPNHNPLKLKKPIAWNQGWSESKAGRLRSASGGVASALAEAVIRQGGTVGSCFFKEGQFGFKLIESTEELEDFRGSKYVKSDPRGIYRTVKEKLAQGRTVLFIGLPCQTAGLINYVGLKLSEKLTVVDLICHGTPSKEMLSLFLAQHGRDLSSIRRIEFRRGNNYSLYIDGAALIHPRLQDRYSLSFLKSLNFTENCYHCRYAKIERVSDITLGDSWGSRLPDAEYRNGISLVLCQTEKGMQLLKKAELHLEPVDLEEAIRNNHQLNRPAQKSEKRKLFIKAMKNGGSYDWAVMCAYPKECVKLSLKQIILKTMDFLKIVKIRNKESEIGTDEEHIA